MKQKLFVRTAHRNGFWLMEEAPQGRDPLADLLRPIIFYSLFTQSPS